MIILTGSALQVLFFYMSVMLASLFFFFQEALYLHSDTHTL